MELTTLAQAAGRGDDALLALAARGDGEAFAMLIEPRADRLLRIARAILRNEAEARDATQEALVAAWTRLPSLRDTGRFDAWIHRVLVNACRKSLRARRRRPEIGLGTEELSAPDPAPARLDTAAVRAALSRIPVEDQHILLLHHLIGLSLDDVARQLRIPAGTAKSRLWSARRALERALEAET